MWGISFWPALRDPRAHYRQDARAKTAFANPRLFPEFNVQLLRWTLLVLFCALASVAFFAWVEQGGQISGGLDRPPFSSTHRAVGYRFTDSVLTDEFFCVISRRDTRISYFAHDGRLMVNDQKYEFPKGANTAFVYYDGSVHFVDLPEEYFIRLPLSFLYEDRREPLFTLRAKRGYRAFVRWDLLEQRPEWPLVEGDPDDYPEFGLGLHDLKVLGAETSARSVIQ